MQVTAKGPHGKMIVDVNKLRPMSRCAAAQRQHADSAISLHLVQPIKLTSFRITCSFGGSIYGAIGSVFEIPR